MLPMITDMGGNVGIQTLSVSIRSIVLGEVRLSEYWQAAKKRDCGWLGQRFAARPSFCRTCYLVQSSLVLGLVAGGALAVNVLVAGIVGGTLPFLIKRWGGDPAMMTGPALTTITDITGVTIYLGLSTYFLMSLVVGKLVICLFVNGYPGKPVKCKSVRYRGNPIPTCTSFFFLLYP